MKHWNLQSNKNRVCKGLSGNRQPLVLNPDIGLITYRSADKVYKEFMLYVIGRNINKYCRFLNEKLKKFEGKTTEKTA